MTKMIEFSRVEPGYSKVAALSFSLVLAASALSVSAKSQSASKPKPVAAESAVSTAAKVPLESGAIVEKIKASKIFAVDAPLRVVLKGSEVEILTVRNLKDNDQDCKIDAVLAAKELFDVYGKQVSRAKLILSDAKNGDLSEITVTAGDVHAYANGSIDRDTLLSSLEIRPCEPEADAKVVDAASPGDSSPVPGTRGATAGGAAVVEGPLKNARSMLEDRIARLESSGTDTKPFRSIFANIEKRATESLGPTEKAALRLDIAKLNSHLAEQEELVRQAHNIENGVGSPVSRSERLMQSFQGGANAGLHPHSLFKQVQSRINELQNQGKNESADLAEFKRIGSLFAERNIPEARKQLEELARHLGLDPSRRQ